MKNQNSHKDNLIKELGLAKPSLEVFDYFIKEQGFNIPESSQESHKKLVRALQLKGDGFNPFSKSERNTSTDFTNGYIIIPEDWPSSYEDKFYDAFDTSSVGGLTSSGRVFDSSGQHEFLFKENFESSRLDDYKIIKSLSLKFVGFDNAHYFQNKLTVEDGAKELARQFKEYYDKNK